MCVSVKSSLCGLWTYTLVGWNSLSCSHGFQPFIFHWRNKSEVCKEVAGAQGHFPMSEAAYTCCATPWCSCSDMLPHTEESCCSSWVWRFQPIPGSAQGFESMEAYCGGSIWRAMYVRVHVFFSQQGGRKQKDLANEDNSHWASLLAYRFLEDTTDPDYITY